MAEQFWQNDRRLGDYEILEEIGQGGMGVVYKAQHTLLNQIVALKVVQDPCLGDRQAVLRFRQEMVSLGRLNHPNVIRALNAGEDRGFHFLVTEFVDGLTFRELARRGPLSVGAACELIRQAAEGLQYVHSLGLVHRDIKPANLMLARDGVVKILDLGLARLDTAAGRELTRPGIAMGTADYMAPEQWADSSSVDIRADIYSLGCTLFFLLTERPPSASECQETQPGGWLAGPMAAPVVRLSKQRSDCPPELDTMLQYMLAEDADDRFDTPDEVAEAIAVFADARELSALLAPGSEGGSSAARRSGSLRDTPRRRARQTSLPTHSSELPTGKDWRRRSRLREASGLGTALIAVVAVWMALHFTGNDSEPARSLDRPPAAAMSEIVHEVGALPGLNGPWWFDETPWLVPYVRRAIADDLRTGIPPPPLAGNASSVANPLLQADVAAVQDWLLRLARDTQTRLTAAESDLLDELIRISHEDLLDEQLAQRLQGVLQLFQQATASAEPCPLHLHTRAVLEHKIAAISNDSALADSAAQSYAAALDAYERLGPAAASLRARCLVDGGQLYALVFKDYAQARHRFRKARSLPDVPLLLQVEAWVNEAIASSVANPNAADKYAEAGYALTSARDLLENSELHRLNHPLAAHVHERYAWILMNQWNVRRASAEFQEARSIRFDNFWKSKNDFAQIFVFHNDHGQAMAERYSGDARIARAQYDLVIGEIEKAMARVDAQHDRRGTQRFRRELRERYSNACERRADCELYQGAASGAPVDLQEAARLYALARDHADDAAVRATMCCKRAITLALDGRVDEAEQELQQQAAMCQMVIGIHEERVRLLRKLAEAVLTLRRTGTDEGLAALRAFLKHFDLNPDYPDRQRRETQELQLLAAELLLATQLHDPQRSGAAEMDADYLDRLVAAFPYREQMLAYLRRYYDLLIGARDHSDPERAAGYILASRNQRPVPEATMVLFHFATDHGRVIVRSLDGQVEHFPLEFGRQHIKTANGSPSGTIGPRKPGELVLPQRLVDLIRCEQQAGRRVVMFWDDSPCWARAEAAITSTDWPFAPQLELIAAESVGTGREPRRKASDD